jgi:uncharacterized Zn finger protein
MINMPPSIMVIDDDINDIENFCPKCSSEDVVLEFNKGYYKFSRCRKCGYKIQETNFHFINKNFS